jgi:hypothetical protein
MLLKLEALTTTSKRNRNFSIAVKSKETGSLFTFLDDFLFSPSFFLFSWYIQMYHKE